MLSRDEVDEFRVIPWGSLDHEDAERLLAHIDALEAFRARVLAVARRLRAAKQAAVGFYDPLHPVIREYYYALEGGTALLLTLAEEAGDG